MGHRDKTGAAIIRESSGMSWVYEGLRVFCLWLFKLGLSVVVLSARSVWWAMGVLFFQHLILFGPHYVGEATFYRDFANIYYPLTSFWVSWVKAGVFPHWVPFPNLGLPFILTMQSGVFYPPFWIFPAFDFLHYTLLAANVVAALHVLGGVIGAWCYARLLGMSVGAACLVGVAFQFMGCLYNNLQHPDMIRAYAWLPWLFWATHLSFSARCLNARHLLLPLFVWLFVTGAYQGNLIAHSFVLTVFVGLSAVQAYVARERASWVTTRLYLQLLGLALLGLLLSSIYLWPTYELLDYQTRSAMGVKDMRHYWSFSYWHTAIMQSHQEGVYTWQAMISAFITVPVFCLLFFMHLKFLRREWLLVVMTLLSILLAAGHSTPVYRWLVDVFPMLGYSRLLSSDYRGLFCFGLILLAGKLLDDYLEGKLSGYWRGRFTLCIGLLVTYLLLGWLFSAVQLLPPSVIEPLIEKYHGFIVVPYYVLVLWSNTITIFDPWHWLIALGLALLVWASLYFFQHKRTALLCSVIALTLISGFLHWHQEREYWQYKTDDEKFYSGLDMKSPLPVRDVIAEGLPQRPACRNDAGYDVWRAYFLGTFMCNLKDALNVKPRVVVDRSLPLYEYMIEPARPVVLTENALSDCQPEILSAGHASSASIRQTYFGLQEVHYQVSASKDFCFVENELFFPGWSGSIEGESEQITAGPYCDALRSWCLPAGEYGFKTRYETPGLRSGLIASALALAAYALILGVYGWRRFKKPA
jgi:hypothetical protein